MPAPGKTAEQVEAALRAEVAKVAREGVTEAELNRVKTQWVASEVYKLDSVMNQARELGGYWVQGLPLDAGERLIQRLRGVTAEQVKAVAAKYFGDDQLTVGIAAAAAGRSQPQTPHAPAGPAPLEGVHPMFLDQPIRRVLLCQAGLALLLGWGQALAAIPIQHWTQPSGAKVYLVESPALPMVDVHIDFDAGGRRDPAEQAGLAGVTAGMTSKGITAAKNGTGGATPYPQALDENQLGEAWADLGAGFDGGASSDRMSFSLRSLTYPDILPKAVQLAARQLGEPAFPEAIWQRERQRIAAAIREANTRPGTVAGTGLRPGGVRQASVRLRDDRGDAGAHRRAGHAADVPAAGRALPGQGEHGGRGHPRRRPMRWSRPCCRACRPRPPAAASRCRRWLKSSRWRRRWCGTFRSLRPRRMC